jgi:hypothetical protein
MAKKEKTKKQAPAVDPSVPRLSAHPKASRQIRAVKAWSGLSIFLLVQVLSLKAGLPMFDAGMRALAAGTMAYLAGWVLAVVVWRQLAVAEVEDFRRRLTREAEERGAASV